MANSNNKDTQDIKEIIEHVKMRIESCLRNYNSQAETVAILQSDGILPSVVNKIWKTLVNQNPGFFSLYSQNLVLISQIDAFNTLAQQLHDALITSMNAANPDPGPSMMQNNVVNHQAFQGVQMATPPQHIANQIGFEDMINFQNPSQEPQMDIHFPSQNLVNPGDSDQIFTFAQFLANSDGSEDVMSMQMTEIPQDPINLSNNTSAISPQAFFNFSDFVDIIGENTETPYVPHIDASVISAQASANPIQSGHMMGQVTEIPPIPDTSVLPNDSSVISTQHLANPNPNPNPNPNGQIKSETTEMLPILQGNSDVNDGLETNELLQMIGMSNAQQQQQQQQPSPPPLGRSMEGSSSLANELEHFDNIENLDIFQHISLPSDSVFIPLNAFPTDYFPDLMTVSLPSTSSPTSGSGPGSG